MAGSNSGLLHVPQELATLQESSDLIGRRTGEYQSLVARWQDDMILLAFEMGLGNGDRAIIGAVEVREKLTHAIGRIASDDTNVVLLADPVCPFARRIAEHTGCDGTPK